MTPFYYLDGALKGLTIDGDFRPDNVGRYVYLKYTYAVIIQIEGYQFRVWCDVAARHLPPSLPEGALSNVKTEILKQPEEVTKEPPLLVLNNEQMRRLLKVVPDGGEIQIVEGVALDTSS